MSAHAEPISRPEREHPFLICRRSDFPELRARAEREPWKSMKARALRRAQEGPPESSRAVEVQAYLGALALAYLVDEENPRLQAERIAHAITNRLAAVVFDPSLEHAGTVPPMGAAFVAILALDIAWNDLTAEEIRKCEEVIERQIRKIPPKGAWPGARLGTHGTWAIYRGEKTGPDDAYYRDFIGQMTRDGVSTVSPGYAFARLGAGNDRPQKSAYADILEFTGLDQRYYNNPRIQAFYRWLFSASLTPARQFHLFGDVAPVWNPPNSPLLWRVGRFDRQAAAYAAWFLAGQTPPPHILSYVLMTEPLPEPEVPKSQLFRYGGAFFREPEDSSLALGAVLYNIVENDEWHTHEEVNAISLAAYGNRLLVNGGWLGDEMRPPWKNNTVAINGQRHTRRTGEGLSDGLLAEGFDYACGDSGRALKAGRFDRSLFFVHGRSGMGGWFATLDEVQCEAKDSVHFFLQTASENPADLTDVPGLFRYRVNHHARRPGVSVLVAFARNPEKVEQARVESGFLQRTPESGYHNRIEAVFRPDELGHCRILTLYYPVDKGMVEPAIGRVEGKGCRGLLIRHARRDLILESDGHEPAQFEDIEFHGRAAVVRRHDDRVEAFFFVRLGNLFRQGDWGFSSSRPVSLFLRDGRGAISVPGEKAELTLWVPGVKGVQLNGGRIETIGKGEGWLRFEVPAGLYRLEVEQ